MKEQTASLLLIFILAGSLHAQGPLTPPGAPAPTMKTLKEIWDEIATLKAQLNEVQGKVTIEMVAIGNAGNAPDMDFGPGPFGAVSYEYKIGKYEVTNAQYVQFLNAVAAADPNTLYNTSMAAPRGAGSHARARRRTLPTRSRRTWATSR